MSFLLIDQKMDSLSPHSDNLHPSYDDGEDIKDYQIKGIIPIHSDDRVSADSDFNKDGLYGLIILPLLGIVVSTLIFIARKYQVHWVLRCFDYIQRLCRQADVNVQDSETESTTLAPSNETSISAVTSPSTNHPYYWNDFFEYDPSIESSSNDILFVDSAVQTSPLEISFAEEEHFAFETDENILSSLDEDEIIYLNIKEPKLNEDIMESTDIMHSDQALKSTTRSGKLYKLKK